MNEVYEKLQGCLKSVREKTDFKPEIALVSGVYGAGTQGQVYLRLCKRRSGCDHAGPRSLL